MNDKVSNCFCFFAAVVGMAKPTDNVYVNEKTFRKTTNIFTLLQGNLLVSDLGKRRIKID
jgi:hypothetical protein